MRGASKTFECTDYLPVLRIGQYEYCYGDEYGGGRFYREAVRYGSPDFKNTGTSAPQL